jgi:1-acyl-sn-glycerol-3-phosphate acyltransferase
MEKAPDRLKVLEKIKQLELEKRWNEDVEDDPETKELLPNKIDYLNKKLTSKIACSFANRAGTAFFENMIKNKQLIIKDIRGIENFLSVEGGAMITCNHFNVADNYAVWRAIKPYMGKKRLWKVIREGNYTNPPALFGFILRNCNTLPLSQNTQTMKKFLSSIKVLLTRGEKILIYPEQCMWWNYRKPRPLKNGAFNFAVTSKVPVIPAFITMEDSNILGGDGFPVQEYTIHFLKPIYPDNNLTKSQNVENMRNENYNAWVKTYEDFYGIKLKYLENKK